ncbi:MAG: sulfite exporter TauE/SafE family protein [Alphaproteobacteria bacterium]|nr:sulfite exporter TauE/SafE family protein [Alphaproteobacteria bacterium]MCW5740461.1 sulfite exporter TauE/SafE family protein [Alphaproteobacteria bacterium]
MHERDHGWDLAALLAGLPPETALYVALLVTGLVGGATHCLGMCGPFVLSRALGVASLLGAQQNSLWARLRVALLPGYHLGRMLTYAGFGAVAGGAAEGFARVSELDWSRGLFVGAAALLLVLGMIGGPARLHLPGGEWLARRVTRLAPAPGFLGDLTMGLGLGFLPCGLVLAALTASVSAGGALQGALAMASFALGTALPLSLLSGASAVVARRWRERLRRLTWPLLALNLAALGVWLAH